MANFCWNFCCTELAHVHFSVPEMTVETQPEHYGPNMVWAESNLVGKEHKKFLAVKMLEEIPPHSQQNAFEINSC